MYRKWYIYANIIKTDFSKTARQNFVPFSQPIESNFFIPLMLVRHRAALNYVIPQWMNVILQQETSKFLLQAEYMTRIFWSKIFIIGSSELRIPLHHNSRLNCLWNGNSPPSRRPDLDLLPQIDTWRDRSSFVLKCIASDHNNTNIVKADFSKTARQNFILFSQPMEDNFSIALMLVRHRAALNNVLALWMNIILQQETSQFLSQAAYMTWCFEVTFFIIGSSELRITLHHNSRLNCLWNGISQPSCRPDLDLLPPNGHLERLAHICTKMYRKWYINANIIKTDFSKTARQNFMLFSQPIENNFFIPLMLVRHRAALNYVIPQWMNVIFQQET